MWPGIALTHERELIRFARSTATQGIRSTLESILPAIRWGEVLRGTARLVLVPSPFWTGQACMVPVSPDELALIYEISGSRHQEVAALRHQTLGHLIGPTRAAVLMSLLNPCGTNELARRVNMSVATVSEHAAVLRKCALIVTIRQGRSVLHHLTDLGSRLVDPAHAEVT
ncbi:ArsR/SmtB family transcription factor [[Actinomadura] parvosata]|uniref:ArsR/SmtB family transcription factor n=1 Tax=[Actinomadura] parvosata TaxID=1955412 RepID=UPI00406C1F14